MHRHTELSFVAEFRWVSPLQYLKNVWMNAVLRWCMLQGGRHFNTTTAPSCCIPTSYYHLSATLHTISITVVNLQDNRAVCRIFITLLSFSFDSPSYIVIYIAKSKLRICPFPIYYAVHTVAYMYVSWQWWCKETCLHETIEKHACFCRYCSTTFAIISCVPAPFFQQLSTKCNVHL
jgi:hypothetical protein